MEIQLFRRTRGTAKCLRLGVRAWRVRATPPDWVSGLGAILGLAAAVRTWYFCSFPTS